jgi:hypothetical protein
MDDLYFSFTQDNFLMLTTKKSDLPLDELLNFISMKNNIDRIKPIFLKQIHSNNILSTNTAGLYNNYDGIITNNKDNNVTPIIATADCIPLFIYDLKTELYGLIHCGWRGVKSNIHMKALRNFLNKKSKLEDIKIYLGPSIQSCCYQIKDDIVGYFNKDSIANINDKIYLNLFKEISFDFFNAGLDKKNIQFSDICTYENNKCYSYRKNGASHNRMYSMIIKL